jgi:parallel beta-helix repeat protein
MKKIILFVVTSFLFYHNSYAVIFDCNSLSDANGSSNTRTLRYCITQANLTAAKDTINFSVAGTWATVASNYPTIIYPLYINGFSSPGAVQGQLGTGTRLLKVVLNGGGSATVYGFQITASNCEINGLVLQDFYKGIIVSGAAATGNWIWGCYIGTSANGLTAGTTTACYDDGIALNTNTTNNTIGTNGDGSNDANEGNLISANGDGAQFFGEGIAINEGGTIGTDCSGNKIAGNFLGTNETGTAALYTTGLNTQKGTGIQVNFSTANIIGTNGDGVSDALERNVISGNTDAGIVLIGGGSNKIKGNYVGTTKTGLVGLPNYANGGTSILAVEISIKTASNNNIIGTDGDGVGDNIEGNVIGSLSFAAGSAANSYNYGMVIQGCTGNRVAGNKIGIGADGITILDIKCPGSSYIDKCIYVSSSSTGTIIGTNGDGVSDALESNYFGNSGIGVTIDNSNSCTISGNYFGLGTNNITTEQLSTAGVYVLNSSLCRIGSSGSNSLERNYFCNSTQFGVWMERTASNNDLNLIQYNTFGIRPDNVTAPNAKNAILISSNSNSNTIQNNIITKNGTGSSTGAYGAIQIGLPFGGSAAAQSSTITLNQIYKNIGPGISLYVTGSKKNLITQNSIYNNGNASDAAGKFRLGIDFDGDNVTANDNQDPDNGPNDYSNFPIITGAVPGGASCSQQVQGTFNALPLTQYYIEVFSNDVCNGDTSGIDYFSNSNYNYGEGKTYLATSSTFTTDALGNASWNVAVSFSSVAGKYVTATAIQASGTSSNNTSEFSKCYYVTFDAGDAPDTYKTLTASCGPIHLNLNTNLVIGSAVTADSDGQPSVQANLDTDDGIGSLPALTTSATSYTLNVPVVNSSGTTAILYAWLDLNKNGIFESSEFQIATVLSTGAQTINLTWNLSALVCGTTLTSGVTYIRLRLTTDALADNTLTTSVDERSYGQANDGEVEDYKIYISGYDYGDLSSSYPVATALCLEDTATAKVWAGVTKPSSECTQKFSVDASGDGAEEDGLTTSIGPSGASYNWVIRLNANQAAKTVYFGLWCDWDGNTTFTTTAPDAFYSGSAVVTGVTSKNVSVYSPFGITGNSSFRLIVSDVPVTSGMYNATFANGEVEDYILYRILASSSNILVGISQPKANILKWKNTAGLPVTNFIIEKSFDNLSWTTLGSVSPMQGNNSTIQYSFSDDHPGKKNYYRLKFSLADNTYQYSNILPLFDKSAAMPVIIYPNPATNTITIQTSNSNYNKLKILDLTGRIELREEINSINTVVNISNLAAGTHLIKFITKDGVEEVQRFVKIK